MDKLQPNKQDAGVIDLIHPLSTTRLYSRATRKVIPLLLYKVLLPGVRGYMHWSLATFHTITLVNELFPVRKLSKRIVY